MHVMHLWSRPAKAFPKRFILSTLRRLGCKVGFNLPMLLAPENGVAPSRALPIRLQQLGQFVSVQDRTASHILCLIVSQVEFLLCDLCCSYSAASLSHSSASRRSIVTAFGLETDLAAAL
jgi:hypothetical protein